MKIAVAVGLLAGLVTLAILAETDPKAETKPAAPIQTLQTLIFNSRNSLPAEVIATVESGVDVNGVDSMGRTALTEALLLGRLDNVDALLEAGADPSQAGRDGYTPLILASNAGNVGMIEALLSKGADPERATPAGVTVLHTACRSTAEDEPLNQIVAALLKAGADPNAKDAQGFTPLMVAASRGRVEPLRMLLDAGAKINATNTSGLNAITYAVMSGDFASRAGWELDLENPNERTIRSMGLLTMAIEQTESLASVRLLLSKGADINIQDAGGWTPIMRAASIGNIDRYRRIIIDAGGNVETPEAEDQLKGLVKKAQGDQIVLALRNADAYVNLPNNVGADAMTISRMRSDSVGKLIHGLLLEGKRVTAADVTPRTPDSDPDN